MHRAKAEHKPGLLKMLRTNKLSRYKKTKPKLGLFNSVELAIGLEPTTTGLQNQGSTIELRQHCTMHDIVFLFFLLQFFLQNRSNLAKFHNLPTTGSPIIQNSFAGDIGYTCQRLRR